MFEIIKRTYKDSVLLKVGSFNSLSVFVRLITGFILSKGIAYFLMPQGMAITGNLRSFLNSTHGVSVSGLQNGVIKYTAEHKNNISELKQIISTSFFIVTFFTVIVSSILFGFSSFFSDLVFSSYDYSFTIKILAIVIPLFTLNTFLLSIINGLGKYKSIIVINTIGYILNTIVVLFLLWKFKLDGAIIAMLTVPSFLLIITLFWVKDVKSIFIHISLKNFSLKYFNGMTTFVVMALFSALTIPVVHIFIKNYIIDTIGFKEAGYWEAMVKLSQYYLMFIMSLFGLYLLPKLSHNQSDEGFRKIVFQFYKTVLPIVIIGFILIYIFRYYIVLIALTEEFLPIQDMFFWQLLGDFFKIIAFVLAYQMQAKKMFFYYILGEIFYVSVVYLASVYFIDNFNIEGVVMAHALSFILYFILMLFIFRKPLFIKKKINIER